MKHILRTFSILAVAGAFLLGGCSEDDNTYSGPEYVIFGDSLYTFPVFEDIDTLKVVVGSTVKYGYDRNIGIEIVGSKTNAIEGRHYELLDRNVTIKAGELVANVRVKGLGEYIEELDTFKLGLRLVMSDNIASKLYSDETEVHMIKACGFTIDDLVEDGGNWIMEYYLPGQSETIEARRTVEKVDNSRIKIRNVFGHYRDLIVNVDTSGDDVLNPELYIYPQEVLFYSEQFYLKLQSYSGYKSYLMPCHRIMVLNPMYYVEGQGFFGIYTIVMYWISQEEADYYYPEYDD